MGYMSVRPKTGAVEDKGYFGAMGAGAPNTSAMVSSISPLFMKEQRCLEFADVG